MSKSFDQSRKEWASQTTDDIAALLQSYYDVESRQVVSVENQQSGRYSRTELTPTSLLDYAGVDWMVSTEQATHTLAERVTRGQNVTIRTDNGTDRPSESEAIPSAIRNGGLYPTRFVFVRRDGQDVAGAWLLDTKRLFEAIQTSVEPCKYINNDDGTKGRAYRLGDLALEGVVVDSLL